MTREADIREEPTFYDEFAYCIEQGYGSGELWRHMRGKFPDAEMPAALSNFSNWLKTRTTWNEFITRFGRKRAERLWAREQSRLRALGRPGYRPQTLAQLMGEESAEEVPPSRLALKRFA